MPKILMFDFDGTIANTFDLAISITNRLAAQFNYKSIEPDELKNIRNMPIHEIIRHLHIPLVKLPFILAKGRLEMQSNSNSVEPISGLGKTLEQLYSMGARSGILTSNSLKFVNNFLDKNNLQFFDYFPEYSSIWGKAKRLRSFMKNHTLNHDEIVFIGDETRDIEAAKRLGIRSVAVTWGYNSAMALKACKPDFLINAPYELLQIYSEITE